MFDEFDREIFSAGQIIFQQGDMGDCAYLIEEGCVEVFVSKQSGEHRIKLITQGELFGEVTLIDYMPRTATVRAVEKTVLVPIPRKMMEVLLEKSDPVIRHLLLVILDRFRNRNDSSATIHPQIVEDSDHSRLRKAVKGEATLRLSLAHGMSRALTHDEFQLHYQPICNLADGKIAGFEALIRWAHPTDGVLPPKDFLWIAEQTGLIHDIGLWTLDRACRDWPMLNKITKHQSSFVSVNISASQLKKERLVEEVAEIIARHKMDPAHLKLELTETVMVDRPEDALIAMHRLIDLGCSFALDDFGSGHSGLRQLQQYPLNTIKIDGDIVAPILESPQSYEIVRSSVALAHSLGMRVVAESIETEEVRNKLIEMKCDLGQGWHFGKSATLADLAMGYGYA